MGKLYIDSPFGIAPNVLLNDKNLSFRAKGLYTFLQSKPEGWTFSAEKIASQSKDGKDSVKAGLIELESAGFLKRILKRNKEGHLKGYDYILYAQSDDGKADDGKTDDGLADVGEAVDISNKDISKKEKEKKKKNIQALPDEGFNFNEKLEKMFNDKNPSIRVIAMYWQFKEFKFRNKDEYQRNLRRNLRSANALKGYNYIELKYVFDYLNNQNFKWTLETVEKYIIENIELMKNKSFVNSKLGLA